jgi:hypothetical protein
MNDIQIERLIDALLDQTRAIDDLVRVVDEQNVMLMNKDQEHVQSDDEIEIKLMNGDVIKTKK